MKRIFLPAPFLAIAGAIEIDQAWLNALPLVKLSISLGQEAIG